MANCLKTLALLSLAATIASCKEAETYDTRPLNVTFDPTTQAATGHWEVIHGLQSRGEGGACLTVRMTELWAKIAPIEPSCDPAQATGSPEDTCVGFANLLFGDGAYGYCHPVQHKCWVKPRGNVCRRSMDAGQQKLSTRWEYGDQVTNAVPYDFKQTSITGGWPKITYWAVNSCIWEVDNNNVKKKPMSCHFGEPYPVTLP